MDKNGISAEKCKSRRFGELTMALYAPLDDGDQPETNTDEQWQETSNAALSGRAGQ